LPSNVKIKAYLDNNGYINKMVYVDSSLSQLQALLDIYTNGGYPDSIKEFFLESKYYNFQHIGGNITHSVHDYIDFFSQNYRVTMEYYYTDKSNTNKLPFQNDIFIFYSVGYATYSTNPVYLLG